MTRRLLLRLAVGVGVLIVALVVWHGPLLYSLGTWLRVEDRLERADAIVVLAGGTPRREATAAALWREGWAPRIIISRPFERTELRELIDLGIRPFDQQGESQKALETYGVPPERVIALPDISATTEPELAFVRDAARARDYRRLILVTSPEHTRRVKVIWARQSPAGPQAIVVPTREPFPFDHWWRSRRAAERVLHEYLGHLVLALGISHLFR